MKRIIIILLPTLLSLPTYAQPKLLGFKQTPHIIDGDTVIIEEPVFSADTRMIHIEQMPDPGYDVNAFIAKNLVYPPYAYDNGIEGRVNVQFVVTEAGYLDSAKVVKSPDTSLNREALRIINSLPQPWKPGKNMGKIVRVHYTLPVTFRLD